MFQMRLPKRSTLISTSVADLADPAVPGRDYLLGERALPSRALRDIFGTMNGGFVLFLASLAQ